MTDFTFIVCFCLLTSLGLLSIGCNDQRGKIETTNSTESDENGNKSIMAIFAHPDDESTVAPMLSKYVREGIKVHLVIATDGRLGVNEFTEHEAGEGLVKIRKNEMICSAEKLGVDLIHLDYHDQLKAEEGYDGHMPHARSLIKEIHKLVSELKPNVLVTFGPDGGSNHLDHRLIGATTTAVYLSRQWDHKMSLFYVGSPAQKINSEESRMLRGVDEQYLTTKISFDSKDLETAIESFSCHESQVQVEKVRERMENRYTKDMTIYLRKFTPPKEYSDNIFQ